MSMHPAAIRLASYVIACGDAGEQADMGHELAERDDTQRLWPDLCRDILAQPPLAPRKAELGLELANRIVNS